MRILWLCNIMLPMIAQQLHMEASNKEGWLSGLAGAVLERREKNGIELAVAFPASGIPRESAGVEEIIGNECYIYRGTARTGENELCWYAFAEDTANPHVYDEKLEPQMNAILRDFQPDIVHCFGTEYPHTLAMCRSFVRKDRILIGIQGLCKVYADAYFASLPEKVINSVTLRDLLKKDTLLRQQRKFVLRGEMEYEAVRLAGNVTGRTAWDRSYTAEWNPNARYFKMNETLRSNFYTGQWSLEGCEPHSIFLSQGDYPIKGLHFMLLALPAIRSVFPDVKVYVAGNGITGEGSLVRRLKISAYGNYLRRLIRRHNLQEQLCFLGRLDAEQMKERYLKSNLFVCCSSIENSPNSLGEAMILGVPCVSADVGGITSIFDQGKDGILYAGFENSDNLINNRRNEITETGNAPDRELESVASNLAHAVIQILSNAVEMREYSNNARNHAKITHNKEENYHRMTEIYAEIMNQKKQSEKLQKQISGQNEQNRQTPHFVFVSNYINHHQIPFCNACDERLKGAFVFVQTEPMEEERVRMGWQVQKELPYVKYYYEEPELCRKLLLNAPVVLFGGVDNECYIQERLRNGSPVIRYSERLYKEGQWKAVSPRGLLKKYHDHTRYRGKPVYLLCAGAYVPSDFHIIRAYPGKMLKWGYFPETRHYDADKLMKEKKTNVILWAARFLDWKHPETALECARYLKRKGRPFHMNIVGDGERRPLVERMLAKYELSDCVTLLGYRSPEEVRGLMEEAAVYIATSDRREGWGAVINEAMNSGCAVIASHLMGAAPYLIRQGENGFLYETGKAEQLYVYAERLLRDRDLCERLGRAALADIETVWNAEKAAERLLQFCETCETAEEGPCSPAEIISERKMVWKAL